MSVNGAKILFFIFVGKHSFRYILGKQCTAVPTRLFLEISVLMACGKLYSFFIITKNISIFNTIRWKISNNNRLYKMGKQLIVYLNYQEKTRAEALKP